ncbi:transcriptional regulator, IclR family [Pseudarthrobacter chlorophenolicus A6]|uniref:Glycerol operon regulatory protein n=1 Tax=Pseudarthrobacter chlorophenolicus (strain ATCC 700700 / DSM 12829 / CIP 107037 / JCM 12360 / KCTC 9906 / NCIMB 13794 / A6) TaxID=452863 RepID=B8H7Z6_PSECP|nr:IclR family transcriptional regulator C-terminal domain-containing protein [Pseudarthrobacter chlorophenolicus]ACL41799.1 transcriptional regulator, IclR family [Pseudarthrobacter chlorophenolicus A6]SDQ58280.1 transcriptional regulator, IclR family [Pseudarthrobacter chlorophenolicus]
MTDAVRTDTQPPQASDQFVQSLARGLAVIRAFDAERPVMTLSEVAGQTGLTRATARRFLHTLVELGYVRTDGKTFALTAKVLQLGYAYLSGLSLPQLAQPHLEELSLKLGESTSAAVLDGADIAYIARVTTRRIMTVGITVGTRFPAYATSMGRVLLANLPAPALKEYLATAEIRPLTPRALGTAPELLAVLATVRAQGWCLLDQELEPGLMSVAAPVFDGAKVVAAVNVSLQAQAVAAREDPDAYLASVAQEISATAKLISVDLTARG